VYGAKKFIAQYPSNPWTMSGLIKWLLNTGHITFWGDLTKVAVTLFALINSTNIWYIDCQ